MQILPEILGQSDTLEKMLSINALEVIVILVGSTIRGKTKFEPKILRNDEDSRSFSLSD